MNRSLLLVGSLALSACSTASASLSATTDGATVATTATPSSVASTPSLVPTLAITSADGAVTVVRDGADTGTFAHARLAVDGHTLVSSAPSSPDATLVKWIDIATGKFLGSATVKGTVELASIDETGEWATMVSPASAPVGDDIAGGRSSTDVVIARKPAAADQPGNVVYHATLPGNVLPEMVGPPYGGVPSSVFMLEYLPADHPAVYRVRVLDTGSSTLYIPSDLREKVQAADESMAGISRAQVMVSSRKLLLTLYRGRNPDGTLYSFIHALRYDGIDEGPWPGTYCLDLPDSLQLQSSAGSAAVSADQQMMFIANGSGVLGSFQVRDLDDRSKAPALHATGQVKDTANHAPAITASSDAVWVAYDNAVSELNPADLGLRQRFTLPDPVLAIATAAAGIIAVSEAAVSVVDIHGTVLERIAINVGHPVRVAVVS